ncbi:MAG: hypothetical protein ACFFDT_23905 [Candidatus Hodarchaeota archaeon]
MNGNANQQKNVKSYLERWQGRLTIGFGLFIDLIAIPMTIILEISDKHQYPLEPLRFLRSIVMVFLFSAGAFYLITTLMLIEDRQFNRSQYISTEEEDDAKL